VAFNRKGRGEKTQRAQSHFYHKEYREKTPSTQSTVLLQLQNIKIIRVFRVSVADLTAKFAKKKREGCKAVFLPQRATEKKHRAHKVQFYCNYRTSKSSVFSVPPWLI